jgi:hypothetical protein
LGKGDRQRLTRPNFQQDFCGSRQDAIQKNKPDREPTVRNEPSASA